MENLVHKKKPKWYNDYPAACEKVREKKNACLNTKPISTDKAWREMGNLICVRT